MLLYIQHKGNSTEVPLQLNLLGLEFASCRFNYGGKESESNGGKSESALQSRWACRMVGIVQRGNIGLYACSVD